MIAIDIDQEKDSDESSHSSVSHDQSQESDGKYEEYGKSKEKNYEAYRTKNLPEGYAPYNGSDQAVELVYDRYDSDYEADQADQEAKSATPKESCCKKGRLSNMENGNDFHTRGPCKGVKLRIKCLSRFKESHQRAPVYS